MKRLFILPVLTLLLLFVGTFVFVGVNQASAAITTPYTVDEKPQVTFGDSFPVLTYFGLENYTHDYVNDYLHITFTYTHLALDLFCCNAGHPAHIYLTTTDPRATSTPIVKSNQAIYVLREKPIPPGHETDWYLYDVQFDETGYRVLVKQRGEIVTTNFHLDIPDLAPTDWVALANLHPLAEPPFTTINSMSFTPLPIKESTQTIDPVIIIPGIMGSAYKNGKLVIDPILHTYDDLIATLDQNGYTPDVDLFTFPYEWRDSNVFSANLLDDKIEEVKAICQCTKVDLVAHSMGGLVARAYIQSTDYDNDVDQVIFLGVPHRGSVIDYIKWEAGQFIPEVFDTLLGIFFQAEAARNGYLSTFSYIRNRPILSVQELLPIFDYIKDDDTNIVRSYPNNYPTNPFLESLNANVTHLINSGVRITNIIGNNGVDTVAQIRVVPSTKSGLWEHGEPDGFSTISGDHGLEKGTGDNTVTISGSIVTGITNEEILSTHRRIPTVSENKVFKILTGKESQTNIDSGFEISPKILLLQLLSPIDFVVTAPDGKRIGKNFSTSNKFNEIPNAFYSGFNTDEEYITILNPLDGEYKVEVQGTGSGGKYGVLTSFVSDTTSTTTEIAGLTQPGQITTLEINLSNGNPVQERIITSEVLLNDILKAYELGWITDKKFKDNLVKKARAIIKLEKKIDKNVVKIETKIDKKAAKALIIELKGYNKGKINQQAYDIIKADLEWLINN